GPGSFPTVGGGGGSAGFASSFAFGPGVSTTRGGIGREGISSGDAVGPGVSRLSSSSIPIRLRTIDCAHRRPGPLTTAPPANDAATRTTANSAFRIGAASLPSPERVENSRGRPQGNAVLGEYPGAEGN